MSYLIKHRAFLSYKPKRFTFHRMLQYLCNRVCSETSIPVPSCHVLSCCSILYPLLDRFATDRHPESVYSFRRAGFLVWALLKCQATGSTRRYSYCLTSPGTRFESKRTRSGRAKRADPAYIVHPSTFLRDEWHPKRST